MVILDKTEELRLSANRRLDPKRKSSLGQFFTPAPICRFMALLFENIEGDISLLDPGCGVGSLTAAFCDEVIKRDSTKNVIVDCYDIEPLIEPYLEQTLSFCKNAFGDNVYFESNRHIDDYILTVGNELRNGLFGGSVSKYSHIIMNPPYKKIKTDGSHRKVLSLAGIETVNLYTGFLGLAIKQLKQGGELVAIIPRSFCNGTYYLPFRKFLFSTTALKHIHIFESRKNAFAESDVLQENIIIHCIKGAAQKEVIVTSSASADFFMNTAGKYEASDWSRHKAAFSDLVKPADKQYFLHIPTGTANQKTVADISCFKHKLGELQIEVSTGPVVEFRSTDDLMKAYEPDNSVPILYPTHFNGKLNWPLEGKKPNAIKISAHSKRLLWENTGAFVVTRRLSSKEEKRRIVAYYYDGKLPGRCIGFENKLNVFHFRKKGIDPLTAKGLCVFLNSSLLDQYYRSLGGHTQVNAGDLRSFQYPSLDVLKKWGAAYQPGMEQETIDKLVAAEISILKAKQEMIPA